MTPCVVSGKPTKALPTDRVGFEKQMEIIRAYGAVAADEGKSATEIGKVVPIHQTSVSSTNPFLSESGFIERAGVGNKATPDVVAYHRAIEWAPAKAAEKLAPTMRRTWYWSVLAPRLSFRPLEETEAVRILAEECAAGKAYEGQIRTIFEYLAVAGLIVRDGNQIRRGPQATGTDTTAPPDNGAKAGGASPPVQPPTVNPNVMSTPTVVPGIAFDASIHVTIEELGRLTPEQIKEFFAGMATVLSAKQRAAASDE